MLQLNKQNPFLLLPNLSYLVTPLPFQVLATEESKWTAVLFLLSLTPLLSLHWIDFNIAWAKSAIINYNHIKETVLRILQSREPLPLTWETGASACLTFNCYSGAKHLTKSNLKPPATTNRKHFVSGFHPQEQIGLAGEISLPLQAVTQVRPSLPGSAWRAPLSVLCCFTASVIIIRLLFSCVQSSPWLFLFLPPP